MTKFLHIGLPALILAVTLAIPAQAHPRYYQRSVNYRQDRQQQRIYNGVIQGQIAPREYANLQRRSLAIERQQRRYRNNDGIIDPHERYRLNRRLDGLSRSIYNDRRD